MRIYAVQLFIFNFISPLALDIMVMSQNAINNVSIYLSIHLTPQNIHSRRSREAQRSSQGVARARVWLLCYTTGWPTDCRCYRYITYRRSRNFILRHSVRRRTINRRWADTRTVRDGTGDGGARTYFYHRRG